ncbi:MAG: tyrosine-protein phosphatase [Pseudomonadota bacterium]|nr:tyrosine-protein phosphatase [Pseudomonadota bacterium]
MERTINLEGGCNFRDLGGYHSRAGREIRWGRVFRTGVLSYFTPRDQQHLHRLAVRTICDLRRFEEREHEPTRWPDADTQHLSWDDGSAPPTIRRIVADQSHPYTAVGMHAAMIELYRALPAWMAPRLRGMFERIAQGGLPLIVHCAAGKDRTGIAAALLLEALDIPRATIIQDYLLTNDCDLVQFNVTHQPGEAPGDHPLLGMPEDIRHVLFAADVDYLQAALDQITRDHGDVREYLRREVGVDDAMLSNVQAVLLTNP